MAGFIEADTGYLLQVADQLDPAAATAAKTAAGAARDSAPPCGDPLPGCQAFSTAVVQVADQITTFCTEVEQGIEAFAAVARESAGLYTDANQTAKDTFGRGPWASQS
jgi:ABC-type transporter Mla subunit MlaD